MTDPYDTAFPRPPDTNNPGLTAREYAAIALRVPDSGTDWLDAMIRTNLRQELAKAAMQSLLETEYKGEGAVYEGWNRGLTHECAWIADALLAELEKNEMNLKNRIALCWRILRAKPDSLLSHANRELLPDNSDEMQPRMNESLREMILVFSTQGHSGFSASYARSALDKLLAFEPLRPLTGEESEWGESFDSEGTRQNRRASHVFLRPDGTAYDINGCVFREPNGLCYTSRKSCTEVTFPYTPKTEYVDVQGDAE